MIRAKIAELSVYLPERIVSNQEIEERVNKHGKMIPVGGLERLFGIQERRYAAQAQQVSDLAAAAAQPIVDKIGASNIDFLIFAAACSDLIEPATCNIVQHKLGLNCPSMDIKNACNSFTSALMTASSFIQAGIFNNVLIANGEKLSDAIRFEFENEAQFNSHLAALSLGDAGASVLVTKSADDSGICFQKFLTNGAHWELCTIKGGGSMFPHDASKNYFEGQTVALKDVLAETTELFFHKCLQESGWEIDEIQHFFTHQVSIGTTRIISQMTRIAPSKIEEAFGHYGNTAAASIPLAMHQRLSRGEIQKGDKVVWLGLAAGVSASVQLMIW
ncbi:MAG: 3-oxoacyl-ACP synthase III family protein [Saprospiraceae bacterium]